VWVCGIFSLAMGRVLCIVHGVWCVCSVCFVQCMVLWCGWHWCVVYHGIWCVLVYGV